VKDGRVRELVRRETVADLLARDRVNRQPRKRGRFESARDALPHGD
jgi:hypothetical protein